MTRETSEINVSQPVKVPAQGPAGLGLISINRSVSVLANISPSAAPMVRSIITDVKQDAEANTIATL